MAVAPGEGERRAQRGYVPQYDLGARVIYDSLLSGDLVWVGVADRGAAHFDDIVLGRRDRTVAYQVKTSRDPEPFGLDTLLFGGEALLRKLLTSRVRLAESEKDRSIETVYACDDYPRTTDNLGSGGASFSSAEFIRVHCAHRDLWTLADWRSSAYAAFVARAQAESGLDDIQFESFWRATAFMVGVAARDLGKAGLSSADHQRVAQLAALLPRLAADPADQDRWNIEQLLDRLHWRDPSVLRYSHTFPVDALYETNSKTYADLAQALSQHTSGYVSLVGPPGSGKSTLLAAGLLPTPRAQVLRYLAFVPNESQGLGRAEATSFLHDLISQLSHHGFGKLPAPGAELSELRLQLSEQLLRAAERFRERDVRTVIVVDGLDHVSREEKAERSFVSELPPPASIPPGVLFVLGTQRLELPDVPPGVKDQAKSAGRFIEMAPLTREAVSRLAELSQVPADVDRQEIYARTEGHPLSTRYIIDGLLRGTNAQQREEWLRNGPAYGGDVDVFYRRALHDVEETPNAQHGLALLSLAEGAICPFTLDRLITRQAVDEMLRASGHLLRKDRSGDLSIFHNSFRQFLKTELFVRHGARDEERIHGLYRELAVMAQATDIGDPQQWMELRYRSRAEDHSKVVALARPEIFRKQFVDGRSSDEIRRDINLSFRTVAATKNVALLVELILAAHELTMRVDALGDEVFDAYIALEDFRAARGMLDSSNVNLSAGKGYDLVRALWESGDLDGARELFESLEPLDELLGAKKLNSFRSDNALEEWAEAALAYRNTKVFAEALGRLEVEEDRHGFGFNVDDVRDRLRLLAVRGQLARQPDLDLTSLAQELQLHKEYTPLLHFVAARAAYRAGKASLALSYVLIAAQAAESLHDSNRRALAEVACDLRQNDIALRVMESVKAPTLKTDDAATPSRDRDDSASEVILHAALMARLQLQAQTGTSPKTHLFAILQRRLEALGTALGRVLRDEEERGSVSFDFIGLLDFLERASSDDEFRFDRGHLNGMIGGILRKAVELAEGLGTEVLATLVGEIERRQTDPHSPLGLPAPRHSFAVAMYNIEQDASTASTRLAYEPGADWTPAEAFSRAAEAASALAYFGLREQASAILRAVHTEGLGCYLQATKDPQYVLWQEVFKRANKTDPTGRETRVRFLGRFFEGLSNSEGRGVAQRSVEALLEEAAGCSAPLAAAILDMAESSDLTTWREMVECVVLGVVQADTGYVSVATILFTCIGLPFGTGNLEQTQGTLVKNAPAHQVAHVVQRIQLAVEVEIPAAIRASTLEKLFEIAATRGLALNTCQIDRWKRDSPPDRTERRSDDDPFSTARHLQELKQILGTPEGRPRAYLVKYALTRIAPSTPYEELKSFIDQEPEACANEQIYDEMGRRALTLNRRRDVEYFLGKLESLLQDRGSWGGAWNGDAKQRYFRLRRDAGYIGAEEEAFARFANDLASQGESVDLILQELCDVLEILSPKLSWAEAWQLLQDHLEEFREYRSGADMVDRAELGVEPSDLLAELLFRAFETTSIPLIKMTRTAAIECASAEHGEKLLGVLLDRLWKATSLSQSEASQILWETRSCPKMRPVLETYVPLMLSSMDIEIRRTGARIAQEWGQTLEAKIVPLPMSYNLALPSSSDQEFEPPSGTSESSSGLFTEDYNSWTWTLELPLRLTSKASGIDISNLRYRVASLMGRNMAVSPFHPEANMNQMTRLKRLSLHASYWKLMTASAFRAMREVICELKDARSIHPSIIPILLSEVGLHSPRIPCLAPSVRPDGIFLADMLEPLSRSEPESVWVDRVEEGLVRHEVPGWTVLASASFQQRGFRADQWFAEQWFGPTEPVKKRSLEHHLHSMKQARIDQRIELADSTPTDGAVLHPKRLISTFQERLLMFCPVVAAKLDLIPDQNDAFTYRDHFGKIVVTTLHWRDGGIDAEESDGSLHAFGSAVIVDPSLKDRLREFTSKTYSAQSWRRFEKRRSVVAEKSAIVGTESPFK